MAVSFWLSFYSGCGLKSGLEDQLAFITCISRMRASLYPRLFDAEACFLIAFASPSQGIIIKMHLSAPD
jgi:hypothetical protein